MSLNDLKSNISELKKILADLKELEDRARYADDKRRRVFSSAMTPMIERLKILNNAIPNSLNDISAVRKLSVNSEIISQRRSVSNFKYISDSGQQKMIALNKEDREKYLKELSLSESRLKKINDNSGSRDVIRPSVIAKISNKIFGGIAEKIGNMTGDLKRDLKESNSRFLVSTYVAIGLFASVSVLVLSILLFVILMFMGLDVAIFFWTPPFIAFVTAVVFYTYPAIRKSSLNAEISNELPFASIYMSAVAGSNMEPTKIFKIIADSPEYKHIGVEMRKIINQIEVYGYDLVNALRNVAKATINKKLAELLNGMATNISSGSSLKNYLEKKSQNLLDDYKLERSKYNEVASTFMDVYISVLITAPLILVMLIVIMSLTNLKFGSMSTDSMLTLSIVLVSIVNVIFLVFIQIKQPKV
jgi:hypothetical protein